MIFLPQQRVNAIAKPFQKHEDAVIFTQYKYSLFTNPDVKKMRPGIIAQHFFPHLFEHETFLAECEAKTKQIPTYTTKLKLNLDSSG